MSLASYSHSKGYDLEKYNTLKSNIDAISDAIIQNIKGLHKIDTGVYYPTNEIINPIGKSELIPFIIQSLKSKGVEFYDNNKLYRY